MDMRPIPGTLPSRLPADCQVFVSIYLYLCLVTYLFPSTSYTHPMIPTETKLFVIKTEWSFQAKIDLALLRFFLFRGRAQWLRERKTQWTSLDGTCSQSPGPETPEVTKYNRSCCWGHYSRCSSFPGPGRILARVWQESHPTGRKHRGFSASQV